MYFIPFLFLKRLPELFGTRTYKIGGESISIRRIPKEQYKKAERFFEKQVADNKATDGCTETFDPLAQARAWRVDYGYKYEITMRRVCTSEADDKSKVAKYMMMVFDDERRGHNSLVDFDPESGVKMIRIGAPILNEHGDIPPRRRKKSEHALYFEDAKKIEARRGKKEYVKVKVYGSSAPLHVRFMRILRQGESAVEFGSVATRSPMLVIENADNQKTMSVIPLCDPEIVNGCVESLEFVSEPPQGPLPFNKPPFPNMKMPYQSDTVPNPDTDEDGLANDTQP